MLQQVRVEVINCVQGCMHQYVAAGNIVRKLLILESEHGPLSGYEPAVTEIVEYLDSVSLSTAL